MTQKILSIIVPTYNMEKYLSYCLDSFLINKNRDKLEVIIVNDGSKDKSLEIANEYVSRAADIFRVIDKKNGNYGSCINAALPEVNAKYVKVVDADDSVNTSHLDEFITFLSNNDVDLALSDFVLVDEERVEFKNISYNWGKSLMTMKEVCVTDRFKDMEMHAVTYRRELLIRMRYRQTEGVSYTDQQWIFAPMSVINAVGVFNKPVYRYLVGRSGQTIDPEVKIKKMSDRTKYVLDMIALYDKLCQSVEPEVKSYLDARIFPNIKDIYITYFTNPSLVSFDLINDFDIQFKKYSSVLYRYLGNLNIYIKLWRRLARYSVMNLAFCKIFSVLLVLKNR
ncbi:MAG: glycosyltransferase family A protein [Phocaeicola sp.]|nr:glycosyltransferase family A protein [Phocaeicola sp.]